jgi:CHAT domain-containing protein
MLGDLSILTVSDMKRGLSFDGLDLLTLSEGDTDSSIYGGNGSEVESVGDALMNKGAMSVLTTLWPVNDISTPTLMADFYSLCYVESMDKAQALRTAQLNVMNNVGLEKGDGPRAFLFSDADRRKHLFSVDYRRGFEKPVATPWTGKGFSHPYYWAPFIIMGNWK